MRQSCPVSRAVLAIGDNVLHFKDHLLSMVMLAVFTAKSYRPNKKALTPFKV
jgi:hypothetical protein